MSMEMEREQPEFKVTQEHTYDGLQALVFIKTHPDMVAHVAEQVARMNREEFREGYHVVWGVGWTATISQDDRYRRLADVIASVRVKSHAEFEELSAAISEVDGVESLMDDVVERYHIVRRGHNGMPQ